MNDIVTISLENDMDLVLAHKRTMKVAEKLGLTTATQTTFATAVSEIARTVIEHTDNGTLTIGLEQAKQRYGLKAIFSFESEFRFTNVDEGYYYAQKLVPEFNMTESDGITVIEMKTGLPRSLNLDRAKIALLQDYFVKEQPLNAYEEIKKKHDSLYRIAEEQEEELKRSKIIDEKKTEFLSVASHEIKTPITIIKAYSQIAKKSKEGCNDYVKEVLDKIDIQASKLLTLVQQLLDISKIENGSLLYMMESATIDPFVAEIATIMENILPYHQLTIDLNSKAKVNIDAIRMEQVLSNLLGNAAKYSEKDSVIHIQTSIYEENFVKVTVIDQGIGLSEESMQSVFKKFYRDKDVLKSHSGLGMGLYVASKIVADHGGRIWVDSIQGSGSKFSFTIPLIEEV